ncbi:MAG: polyphosphate kinase 1 [Bacteroidales bacterium]|nr:polyphosphate kinase 1 [Bacteroidales bacterium]
MARYFSLPVKKQSHRIIFREDIVMKFIDKIFPGYHIDSWYSIKMTRDADLDYDEEVGAQLIDIIENISHTRQLGNPNRFQYDSKMPKRMLDYLCETFHITSDDLVKAGAYHNFRDFFALPNPLSPNLENPRHIPLMIKELDEAPSLLDMVARKEYMLHFPYQSFLYFIRFLNEAARDESVVEIKATQYRVANNSAVVNALINAANHNKKVTVFVELKARFDEEANLKFAKEMKSSGITVIYSIPGLKVHSKLALITRNIQGEKFTSAFLATGNFNEKTALLYSDIGFFTSDPRITNEIESLFEILKGNKIRPVFNHILIPNYNMVETYCNLIKNEIENVKKGRKGYMILKMNGLDDPFIISKLYEASLEGVKIDCIIRGSCCLKTNQVYSKNIRVIRIVDRFLEHGRIFVFYNNGDPSVYAGSADWMRRNLYRRIECVFPIYDINKRNEIIDMLNIQLLDNVKASEINENSENVRIVNNQKPLRAQKEIHEYLKGKNLQ